MFMVFISPTLEPGGVMQMEGSVVTDPSTDLLFRFCQLGALLITLLICWRLSDGLSTMQGVIITLFCAAALIGLGFLFLTLLDSPDSAANPSVRLFVPPAIAILIGIGQGFMILLWSSFLCSLGEHRILFFLSLCVGCAAGLTLLMLFLQPTPAIWITLAIAWLSLGCFAYIRFRLPEPPKALLVKAKVSDKRVNIKVKSTISVVIYSSALGFAVCYIVASGSGIPGLAAAAVAVILAAVIAGLDATRLHIITEGHLAELHMPVVICGLAPLFFDNLLAQIAGCTLLICFFMIVYIVNLTSLSEHVRIYRLNSVRTFGLGRTANALGFLLGGLLCYLLRYAPSLPALSGLDSRVWTNMLMLVFMGVFVFASSFIFEDHYPASKGAGRVAGQAVPLTGKPRVPETRNSLPRGDLRTLSTYMLSQPNNKEGLQSGVWSKRVAALSKECLLSPKETEVLFLLAKGRNADYIQTKLVVSRHTAKAHIYHIYQKTGVHSRQALIDLLESIEIEYE
jgi:DNA-binding CsgD family transcriptional regulator